MTLSGGTPSGRPTNTQEEVQAIHNLTQSLTPVALALAATLFGGALLTAPASGQARPPTTAVIDETDALRQRLAEQERVLARLRAELRAHTARLDQQDMHLDSLPTDPDPAPPIEPSPVEVHGLVGG